jgi:glyoxylase-like metal-dependent hydrolase (beta-lactamase superfamily II)/rhodanese-related sulfurtransferase
MAIQVEELNREGCCKSYLLSADGLAILVDPIRERVPGYLRDLAARNLELAYVLETHTHADHLMVNREQKARLRAEVLMHRNSPSPLVDRHLEDEEELPLGDQTLHVWHTPGHTPDSMCLVFEGGVLTGDTLLIGGSGRTDFPGGDAGAQYDAVTNRLFRLPDATVVYPAHDYNQKQSSSIASERAQNARFLGKTRDEYVRAMANLGLPFPDALQSALQVNQSGFESSEVVFPLVADVATVVQLDSEALFRLLASPDPPLVIDVREPEEFVGELGHIQGALLVPLDLLQLRLPKLAGYVGRPVVCVCRAGARSASAAAMLAKAGFGNVANLGGGMLAWAAKQLPVQR